MDYAFTPTQQRILKVLSDGLPHQRQELHACLNDSLRPYTAIHQQITAIRKGLSLRGETIICELYHRQIHYRHVRLLVPTATYTKVL